MLSPRLLVLPFVALAPALFAALPDPLDAGFVSPPADARPLVWWHWINGNVTKEGIESDLADMRRVGIGGVQMFDASIYLPAGPVRYGSDAWHEHVQHAIATAEKLGLEIHLMNTPGWSASGGPWVTPERSMKQLVWSETPAAGGRPLTIALPPAELPKLRFRTPPREPQRNFHRDIVVLAVPTDATRRTPDWNVKTKLAEKSLAALPLDLDPTGAIPRDRVLNLAPSFDPATGNLRATLPAGNWTVLRFGYTSTGSTNHPSVPEGHGLEIDKLDAAAVDFYFDQALGRILREAGPRVGRTLKGILFDSFEGGPQNWTDTFPEQFAALKGYDLLPLLPVLTGRVIENATFTECVLRDFRGAVEELIARNYFGTMRRRAHEHGMITYAEAQGGPLNPVSSNEHVDVPMNEFWMPDTAPRYPRIKLVASVANVLGRRMVGAESFTATPENGRWQNVPSRLKNPGDYAWTAGINRFILHHYTHQPTDHGPGFGLGRYGTNFGRLNTWWPLAGGWISYVARSQFLLQQGTTVADIAFLQTEDHGYAFPSAMVNVPAGYDFTIVYPHHLTDMSFRDGAMVLPAGPSYRMLVLPDKWAAEVRTLERLRDLVRTGAWISGPAPAAPAGVQDYEHRNQFAALVAELWGDGQNQARIRPRLPLQSALRDARIAPDVGWPEHKRAGELRYIHRRTPAAEIYFVFNHSPEPADNDITFRVQDRIPELWNPVAGSRSIAPVYRSSRDGMVVPIQLEPLGSTFVVFRRPLPARWVESVTPRLESAAGRLLARGGEAITFRSSNGRTTTQSTPKVPPPLPVDRPWQVTFEPGRGAPAEATFVQLKSWTDHAEDGIRFFSGVATYRTTFVLPAAGWQTGTVAFLDLGQVADLAEVRLNGESAGIWWQPPFRADVTSLLRAGENTLEVRVANRWINRLIGDEQIPTELTYQKPGTNKFTDGRLEQLPAWLYDRSKLAENKRHSFATWKHYTADWPLVPSGLLGPVRIEWRAMVSP